MTPWELVTSHYQFPEKLGSEPFVPAPLQIDVINELAPKSNAGIYLDMGTGKTFVSTACALYHRVTSGCRTVVIMPPYLISQWAAWLATINPKLTVTEYRGTPKKRQELSLDADFVLVGVQIFKKDYTRFTQAYRNSQYCVLVDEATFVSNINSQNHDMVYDFSLGHPVYLITGTPINNPMDAYGMIKFTAPGTYRSKRQFENEHIEEYDFYGKPKLWRDLPRLKENLAKNTRRVLYADMYSGVVTPLYDHIQYDLDGDHYRLYRQLAHENLLVSEDGGKVDATSANKLLHALGQIVCNYGHFAGDPSLTCTPVELVRSTVRELGDSKLVVFAHYRMTVRNLTKALEEYGAVAINSEVSREQQQASLERFLRDPGCRVIVVQYISGGKGLDGMQHVSHTALCIEPCAQPRDFHQAIARVQRKGQKKRVHVILPTARFTLQRDSFKALIKGDSLMTQVVRSSVDLKAEIMGQKAR